MIFVILAEGQGLDNDVAPAHAPLFWPRPRSPLTRRWRCIFCLSGKTNTVTIFGSALTSITFNTLQDEVMLEEASPVCKVIPPVQKPTFSSSKIILNIVPHFLLQFICEHIHVLAQTLQLKSQDGQPRQCTYSLFVSILIYALSDGVWKRSRHLLVIPLPYPAF